MIQNILGKLFNGTDLTQEEMQSAMGEVLEGQCTPAQIGAFLAALRCKGETVDEVAGAVAILRDKSTKVTTTRENLVDTCGTGGDHSGTFNISTTAAVITAAAGVPVAKHGNKAMSSACGSANVLQALGLNMEQTAEKVGQSIDEHGLGFLFAMKLHSAMKHVGPARREIGQRTIFNILGPLINPAGAKRQVLGVFDAAWTEKLAQVLQKLGSEHVLVAAAKDGLDEISTTASTQVTELKGGVIRTFTIEPGEFDISPASVEDLRGGDPETNAGILRNIFSGDKGPRRDIAALNAGAAIYVGGKASSIKEGYAQAQEAIDSGKAKETLKQFIAFSQSG